MVSVAATFCATLVDEWARAGVRHAVVAPGSRSTPMALALARDGRLEVHVVLDERSAGFLALGISLASRHPAVVLTTSGTAAVELHPAVVEAHHAGAPLIVCTADRPPAAQGVGAPQTIDQPGLYPGVLRWQASPGLPDEAWSHTWRSLGSRCVSEALGPRGRGGPVHLNLVFSEPLVGDPGTPPPGRPSGSPWHVRVAGAARAPDAAVSALAEQLSGRCGVMVAGAGAGEGPPGPAAVTALAEALGWPVLADPLSSCRQPGPATVAAVDSLLRHPPFADRSAPDVTLRLGGVPASKVLANWLSSSCGEQVVVGPAGHLLDPDLGASLVMTDEPATLAERVVIAGVQPAPPGWLDMWCQAERRAQSAIDETLACMALSEPAVARSVMDALPEATTMVVSSSMPVRDLEWFAAPRHGVRVLANRGVNGIDGVVSTTLGVAAGSGEPTVGLLGDLAFLHDVGGLLRAGERGGNCTLVVVDNDGGGIFSFLEQADVLEPDVFTDLFATPHGLELTCLARAYGLRAATVTDEEDLRGRLHDAMDAGGVHVLVVHTDRTANVEVHQAITASIAKALEAPTSPS